MTDAPLPRHDEFPSWAWKATLYLSLLLTAPHALRVWLRDWDLI